MSIPSITTEPWSGISRPAIILRRVDLPQPDPPRMVNNSPLWIFKFTFFTALVALKVFEIPSIWINASLLFELMLSLSDLLFENSLLIIYKTRF